MENGFTFTGQWEPELDFEYFGKNIDLQICDQYLDPDPDPKPEQMNTINYLLSSTGQIEVIESILAYLVTDIYPYYQEHYNSYEQSPHQYPEIKTVVDFCSKFRFEGITVFNNIKDDMAYYSLTLYTRLLEGEHGLSLDMYRSRCIDHGPGEGTEGYKLAEELNIPADYVQKLYAQEQNEDPVIHQAHPKYKTLKPWQVESNRRFPINAYRKLNDADMIAAFARAGLDLKKYPDFYRYAKKDGREGLIAFFEG